MIQRFEGHFKGFDQCELFFQTWTPQNVRGTIIITHGLAEHGECYHPLAKVLAEDGWQVFAWDMRGHGRSEGKRGFVMNISDFIADYACFISLVQRQAKTPANRMVLFGHSLGGLVTIRYAETQKATYGAMVLSSPGLGLSIAVPKLKDLIAKVARHWLPTLTLYNEIKYSDLSRDEAMVNSYAKDSLRHDKISPGLFLSMVENFPLALQDADKLQNPVLLQLAGEDRLASTQASLLFTERLPNKKSQAIVYPESYHEIFNDLDRDKAIADLKKFINPYLGA